MTDPRPIPQVPVSVGELIDKITILEIKSERITDPAKRANILNELGRLQEIRARVIGPSAEIEALAAELKQANLTLWGVEESIRTFERAQRFDDEFIRLARSVYRGNDRRAAVKRRINEVAGSAIIEEKSHPDY